MECPAGCRLVVWKYGLVAYFSAKHPQGGGAHDERGQERARSLQALQAKKGHQSNRLTASLFIKTKKFMEKRKKVVVVLIQEAIRVMRVDMVICW
eukprot:1106645-Pelagomonas_calceolata.AAC.2